MTTLTSKDFPAKKRKKKQSEDRAHRKEEREDRAHRPKEDRDARTA